MNLTAWVDENNSLYVAGKDYAGQDRDAACNASIEEVIEAANHHLDQVDPDGDWLRLELDDAIRFDTIWVAPEAFDEDLWDDEQWSPASMEEEDAVFWAKGWASVLRMELVSA